MGKEPWRSGPVWALGTMSGTSLDGVDAAMVLTDGTDILDFGPSAFRAYSAAEQDVLRAALGHWPGTPEVASAAQLVEEAHAELLSRFEGAALIGFHGQTLAHEPAGRGTHQAGNGALLAEFLRLPVVWDFRSADVALGGQGAPLAPFYHFALAQRLKAEAPLAFLNLGGVGNLTYIDPSFAAPQEDGALLAFDTGPANAPINDLLMRRLGLARDEAGQIAGKGFADEAVLERFLAHAYFHRMPPKSLDRNDFHALLPMVEAMSTEDAAATLTAAAAAAVARGFEFFPKPVTRLLVCGGGRHNATLMAELELRTGVTVLPVEAVGLDGDMLEAQAFAYLATRVARGLATSCRSTTGVAAAVGGGQLSRPSDAALEQDAEAGDDAQAGGKPLVHAARPAAE